MAKRQIPTNLSMSKKITLRPADINDSEDIFRWRNDPITRANSFNSSMIQWHEHEQWLGKALAQSDRLLLIGIDESRKIGIVRFDLKQPGEAEININLAPECRGRGYGTALIQEASEHLFQHHPAVRVIYAKVKPDNPASLRAFEKAGYHHFADGEYKTLVLEANKTTAPPTPADNSWKKAIARQMLQLSSANVFVQATRFVKNLAFARILGPNLFGLWNGLQVILVYGANAHLGVLHALNREIPVNRGRGDLELIPRIARVSLSFSLMATLLVAAVLFAIGAALDPAKIEAGALKLIAAVLVAQQLFQFFNFLFRAEDDFGRLAKILFIAAALELVASVALVYWIGFNGSFYGFLISFLCSALICLYWRRELIRSITLDFSLVARLIRIGFPIMLIGLSYGLLTTFDRVLIIKFLGAEQLGYYALGPLALTAIAYIPTTVNQVMYPKFGERYGKTGDRKSLAGFVRVSMLITAHLMGLVLGVAFLIIPWVTFFLQNYAPGIPAARILFAGFYFFSLVGPSANMMVTIDRQIQYLVWLVAAAILVAALNTAALIFNLGIEGVAAATGVSYAIYAFGMIIFTLIRYLDYSGRQLSNLLGKIMLPYAAAAGLIWGVSRFRFHDPLLLIGVQLAVFMIFYGLFSFILMRRELPQ